MKNYRNKRGQYKSRKIINRLALLFVLCTFAYVALAASFGTDSFSAVHIQEVSAAPEVEIIELRGNATPELLEHLYAEAEKYGADAELMRKVIFCESRWDTWAIGDGGKSRGLAQIHKSYHDVSSKDAFDPYYAITFMAQHFGEGREELWSCYKIVTKK